MEQVSQLVVVFFAALATGGLMVNWIGLGRAMSRLSVSTYVEFHQATNHTFDPYMPIVVVGAVLADIVLAILSPGIHSLSGALAIAGSVCYAAVIAIGVPTCVRINKQVARWSVQSPPDDWTFIRARWLRFHIIRTLPHFRVLHYNPLECGHLGQSNRGRFQAASGRLSGNDYHASDTNAGFAEGELYFSLLNRFKREEATFFTDSTANGRIL